MTRDDDRNRGPEPGAGASDGSPAEELVALLYGELEGDEAARVQAQVASDPAAAGHMADLQRVRGMFRELPDEEPPARISAQLLAEAARAAGATRRVQAAEEDGGGWVARLVAWMQPLVQRPGLAAAASLMLVAGIAGVLYVRKGDELARPSARPDVTAERAAGGEAMRDEAPAAEPAATATGTAEEADAPADDALAEGGAGAAAENQNEAARGGATDLRGRRTEKAEAPATKKAARPKATKERAAQSSREYAKPPRAPAPERKPETKATDKGAMAPGAVHGLSEQEFAPPPPPPQQAPSGSAGSIGSGSAPAPAPAPEADSPKAPTKDAPLEKAAPSARDLHTRAVDAALDRRCADVRALERRVRELDARYHRDVFATDSRLRSCLGSSSSGSKTSDQPAKK